MINNNQTNLERTKNSSATTSESLSAAINDTAILITNRKISSTTEGLPCHVENWLRPAFWE